MSPRQNTRPKPPKSLPDTPHSSRDTTAETMLANPVRGEGIDPPSVSPTEHAIETPESLLSTIQISEMASPAAIRAAPASVSLDGYYLSPELVPMLSEPDATSGIRTFRTRTYVELSEGGTVLLGRDSEQNYRARSGIELVASGPRLEQVEGSHLWRQIPHREAMHDSDSDLASTPHRLSDDEASQVAAPKRQRATTSQSEAPGQSAPVFSKNWGIDPRFMVSEFITRDNVHYKVVTRSDAREHPIVYVQPPTHPTYDFDLLEATLRHTPDEQPRGAMQIPPDNHWEIDARLPFEKPLTAYVRDCFPEVTTVTLENIARKQFELANNGPFADAAGLTALRQIFNGWKNAGLAPHPQWSDPLLMLPTLPTTPSSRGAARSITLPAPFSTGTLERLDFDPMLFQRQWLSFQSTYTPVEFKRFMAALLTRNGYTVMEPSSYNSFPALVFQRAEHDQVFFMSLHRTRIPKISLPTYLDPNTAGVLLENQLGEAAAKVVRDAHAANKIIWLKGGTEIRPGIADTVFIIRDDNSRL
ncbi:hypothetical protein SAMN03159382_05611 [Pseudomonas sp. NFACC23-1]|uniref:hypothetical protein n=1 Tax=unclassified Pseudomonas TaxID=196821 RepID=UPI00088D53E6|nr:MULTISPECIES: hypothetical protein [unclassified Pseudomonas]SDB65440.1 hypothetical protein SAMN03159386_05597 [Pseudomonas sp. NFACC17-2]SEJ95648.1 hypothetical protein SAMN03159382_05611 [Pseudomonas sp. NFACC23-1]SFW92897.1 hypothetical protein SAMN05660640_05806 [Pseudomonas sp. NFACC16-2]